MKTQYHGAKKTKKKKRILSEQSLLKEIFVYLTVQKWSLMSISAKNEWILQEWILILEYAISASYILLAIYLVWLPKTIKDLITLMIQKEYLLSFSALITSYCILIVLILRAISYHNITMQDLIYNISYRIFYGNIKYNPVKFFYSNRENVLPEITDYYYVCSSRKLLITYNQNYSE